MEDATTVPDAVVPASEAPRLGRRELFRRGGLLAAGAAAGGLAWKWRGSILEPLRTEVADAAVQPMPVGSDVFMGGTDGWITLPDAPAIGFFHPDSAAPEPYNCYVFGFRNITDLNDTQRSLQKNHAQTSAPLFWVDQFRPEDQKQTTVATAATLPSGTLAVASTAGFPSSGRLSLRTSTGAQVITYAGVSGNSFTGCAGGTGAAAVGATVELDLEFRLSITNLGLAQRPDLFDAHTLHWHGFRNVIPFFDGEPTGSVSVPGGAVFTYVYRPRDPGTYMYHCHVEDTEHVHMGMTGMVFVRPKQNGSTITYKGRPYSRFAYNDGDGSTGHDREYALMLTEVWAEAHWDDAHIQLPDWTDYKVDFACINGRVYPDTVLPSTPLDGRSGLPYHPYQVTVDGDLEAPAVPGGASHPELNRQPLSSLVEGNAGEAVLLRLSNLGFTEASMTTAGLEMRVVGRDATPMRGRDGTDTSYVTTTVPIGPGESFDVIVDLPPHSGGTGPEVYLLYNRNLRAADDVTVTTPGAPPPCRGQMTEIHVYPANTFLPQAYPNYSERSV